MSKDKHPKGNPGPERRNDKPDKENTNRHVYIEPGATIDFVQDLKNKVDPEANGSNAHQEKQLFWTKVASGLLLITAALAFGQGLLTWQSINNNTNQFQIDQRPYLWDSNVTNASNVKIVAGQKMWMNLDLLNFGKAPALKTRGLAKILIGNDAMREADDWFNSIGNKPMATDPGETGIVIPPGVPSGELTEKSAFGGGGYLTAMSDKVLTQEDVDYIMHSNQTVAIVVHTEYFDAYGTRYWSDFCLSRYDTGAYPHCQKHNEIH